MTSQAQQQLLQITTIKKQFDLTPKTTAIIGATNDIEAITIWLKEYKHSHNTFIAYRQAVERYYCYIQQFGKYLADVTREDVQNYSDFLTDPQPRAIWCGSKHHRSHPDWKPFVGALSATSINYQNLILKNLYNYLIQAGYLNKNPFALIKQKQKKDFSNNIEHIIEKPVIQLLMEHLENLPESSTNEQFNKQQAIWLVKLFFLTGMRISEVANSRMNHFVYIRGKWWLKVVGKGNKPANIVVTHELMLALSNYRNYLKLADKFPTSTETLPTIIAKNGDITKGLTANMLHRIIKRIFATAAKHLESINTNASYVLANASAHWLRHASATAQLAAGVALESVKHNLRHESIDTTMRYVHQNEDNRHDETSTKFTL